MRLALSAVLAVLLAGPGAARAQYIQNSGPAPRGGALLGHWRGMLPAEGCDSVETELTLRGGISPSQDDGRYVLSERCLFSPGGWAPRVEEGAWTRLRGAAIFQLAEDAPGEVRSFLRLRDGALQELDARLRPLRPFPERRVLSPGP